MTLEELKKQIGEYQYFEDTDVIDVALASVIATRLKIGDPVWLVIIGASSGGKSQILRPLALTDTKFMHRVDDLTENTFLSGSRVGGETSLLKRIGPLGMMVMSDLTVLFSKSAESRASILSQFRMIYDGEMVKFSGTSDKPIEWKGYLGILAASTPSIYRHFEEVSDMGERFIYYRMKDYDPHEATRLAMNRSVYGKALDERLSESYAEYVKEATLSYDGKPIYLPKKVQERILAVSVFAERVRTTAHTDFKDNNIDRIPVAAMPMRVALQLTALAKGLYIMRKGNLTERDMDIIDWCGYSLANEEKRACLKVMASIPFESFINTAKVADKVGLETSVVRRILQNLSSTGVLIRTAEGQSGLMWKIKEESDWKIVRNIEWIKGYDSDLSRSVTHEEKEEMDEVLNDALRTF